jgi:hypothetical protein
MWATVAGGPVFPVATTASIRGYTVVVTAHPVSYRWAMGDGGVVTGTFSGAGTASAASARYTYNVKGSYTVTLSVTWQGQYTFTGHGLAQTVALNAVAQNPPEQLVYPVQEVRSVLVDPSGSATPPSTVQADRTHC